MIATLRSAVASEETKGEDRFANSYSYDMWDATLGDASLRHYRMNVIEG